MHEQKIVRPPKPNHVIFFWAGVIILLLNKIRYTLRGYREPRPFSPTEIKRAIEYDRSVVTNWLDALFEYNGQRIEHKTVLELGPGADLGPALFLLNQGARKYVTVDAHRLIDQTPPKFYELLIKDFSHKKEIESELNQTFTGRGQKIRYIVDPDFDLSVIGDEPVHVVVSQAAFEHFSDVNRTIKQLSQVVQPGSVLIAEVDLMTHTGVLRNRDPLNIYRIPTWIYKLLSFVGIPNRLRPNDYKQILEQNGWKQIDLMVLQQLPEEYVKNIQPKLAHPFRGKEAEMHVLSLLIRATK